MMMVVIRMMVMRMRMLVVMMRLMVMTMRMMVMRIRMMVIQKTERPVFPSLSLLRLAECRFVGTAFVLNYRFPPRLFDKLVF